MCLCVVCVLGEEGFRVGGRVCVRVRVGGVEFEVECQASELEAVVGRLLGVMVERLRGTGLLNESVPSAVAGAAGMLRAETCRGVIVGLWEEAFFAVSRSLGDVHSEMARRGFHYDRTAVAHALIDLVKDGVLSREGKPRRYVYAQKRPPPVQAVKQLSKDVGAGKGVSGVSGAAVVVKPKDEVKK